jgi:glycosyltransferase involved in cell wall biosynthesis
MGLDVLLRAVPEIVRRRANARFVIVGSDGDLATEARKCADSFPRHVAVVINAPYAELPEYYRTASIAVAPSVNERACLGLAIIEAMACGRAVIGSDVGGTREVLIDGETGFLVPPGESNALADKVVGALVDPQTLELMGQRGRLRAETQFDKDLTNNRFESLVLDIIGPTSALP